ncbi:von Willebrand factor A domain-containing protein 5A [Armadillidium nasatum]|uniref:von Willebrand factor A domain-containing protein 5A n=1 Tax=Armadillidium nasatum TaxID=96803 RepID=A0A5N5SWH9_9CRUS|nr:von Willebrand factor A domain-containing protein 5A [Armadillidium nasatum]
MEKKKAKEVYDKAVEEGHTAILGSEDRFSGDLIHLALGNLPKGNLVRNLAVVYLFSITHILKKLLIWLLIKIARIMENICEKADLRLKMVKELPLRIDGAVEFVLPTIFNPRYTPADQPSGPDIHFSASPASRSFVTPNKSPYSLHVQAQVQGSFKIAKIKSLSDAINVHVDDDETSAKITQDGGTNFDHDWSLQIYYHTVHKPHCLQMSGDRTSTGLMKDDIIMLNLFPEVPFEGYSPHNEIILVVDRSGSMGGSKIAKAKTTLLLFLKSLPPGCRFNVISFGSTFQTLFESSSERYTESTLKKALELQRSMDADMGGTEIFSALRHVYSKKPIPGYPRQIIILTDGEVWNQDQIFDLIQRHSDETRVFAVGIGDGASTALVEGMARAGNGRHEMVAHEDQLQIRVMGLIGNMLQENVKDLTVECKVVPQQDVKLVPKIPPNVFGGQHLILYARLKPNSRIKSVKVGWKIGDDQFSCELKEDDCKSVHDSNFSFHRLAAKAQLIHWLKEDDENVTKEVVNLSVSSSVVCKLTSFVGYDQDKKIIKEKVQIPVIPFFPRIPMHGGGGFSHYNFRSSPVPPATGLQQQGQSTLFGNFSGTSNQVSRSKSAAVSFGCAERSMGGSTLFGMSSNSHDSHLQPSLQQSQNQPPPQFNYMADAGSVGSTGSGLFGSSSHYTASHIKKKIMLCRRVLPGNKLPRSRSSIQSNISNDSSSSESNRETDKDPLIDIISNQQFDGFWTLQYCKIILNLSEDICNSIQTKLSLKDNILGTVLVLAYLESKFVSRKEEWKLVALKGRKFLESNKINPSDCIYCVYLTLYKHRNMNMKLKICIQRIYYGYLELYKHRNMNMKLNIYKLLYLLCISCTIKASEYEYEAEYFVYILNYKSIGILNM